MTDNNLSDLVTVLEAGSEMEAMAISAFLEEQGIEAAVRSRQIPMYDGIARVWNPVWGYVMVMEPDGDRARELIGEYMELLEEQSTTDGEDLE